VLDHHGARPSHRVDQAPKSQSSVSCYLIAVQTKQNLKKIPFCSAALTSSAS
jgi:hypothetical protein